MLRYSVSRAALLVAFAALAACDLSPELKLPHAPAGAAFKEAGKPAADDTQTVQGEWKPANPRADADKGAWWQLFNDPALDALEQQAAAGNFEAKAAAARVEQARAMVRAAQANWFPQMQVGASASRVQQSSAFRGGGGKPDPLTIYRTQADISYETDLFGRVRNGVSIAEADAETALANERNVLLALQADVANQYFQIRALDKEIELLVEAVRKRAEAERIQKVRVREGDVNEQVLAQATTELATTRAALIQAQQARAVREHALAVLLGKAPSEFSLAANPLDIQAPAVPAGLPSDVLQRRPDIAAAIQQVAAANTRIGLARTAFFPILNLSASTGFESAEIGSLFEWSNNTWSVGPLFGTMLAAPVFQGGRNVANLKRAKAGLAEATATYQQSMLVALREVEDALVGLHALHDAGEEFATAQASSAQASRIADVRFEEGDTSYLEVVDADRTHLAAQRAYVQTQAARYGATLQLIRAIGGGWEAPDTTEKSTPVAADLATPAPAATGDAPKPIVNPEHVLKVPATSAPADTPETVGMPLPQPKPAVPTPADQVLRLPSSSEATNLPR